MYYTDFFRSSISTYPHPSAVIRICPLRVGGSSTYTGDFLLSIAIAIPCHSPLTSLPGKPAEQAARGPLLSTSVHQYGKVAQPCWWIRAPKRRLSCAPAYSQIRLQPEAGGAIPTVWLAGEQASGMGVRQGAKGVIRIMTDMRTEWSDGHETTPKTLMSCRCCWAGKSELAL